MKLKDINKPICKQCNIVMEIHKTMSGDQYICDNYHLCGGRILIEKWKGSYNSNLIKVYGDQQAVKNAKDQ